MSNAQIELGVSGMTCTSCSSRVQRKLNKMEGVEASVNFSTETASVEYDPALADPDALIKTIRNAGYDAFTFTDADEPLADAPSEPERDTLLWTIVWSAVVSLPVMLVSMIPALQFTYWQWAAFAATTLVYFSAGSLFHRNALLNLRHGSMTMDTLISMGTTAAYGWSIYALFFGNAGEPGMRMHMSLTPNSAGMDEVYLETVCVVITFLLLGRWFEHRAKGRSSEALRNLLHMGAKDATVLRDGVETRVPIADVKVGDTFVVRPGEKVATDGTVVEGRSAIDASMLTGESVPVDVKEGDDVTGATLNTHGRLLVQATRVGSDTTLAQMGQLVKDAQAGKAPVERLVDRIAQIFVPTVIAISAVSLVVHLLLDYSVAAAFTAAVAVLIIACPCALGLATPTAILVGTGRGAELGLLIRGPEILESTRQVDTIVMDKTGTVTTGEMTVVDANGSSDALALAAAVEAHSEHPIARAITAYVQDARTESVTDFRNEPGIGASATVDGKHVRVGRPSGDLGEYRGAFDAMEATGATVVAVEVDGALEGVIAVRDAVKEDSRVGVEKLKELGLEPHLLTGDNRATALAVAKEVGIDAANVTAGVLPADKVELVRSLQDAGKRVAMIGDGVNDAAALAQADLGMAMGAGTDVAIEASDITLMNNSLVSAADGIRLSRATLRTIKGNLFWAFAYNVVLIPVAAIGLLNPLLAGIAMACSSVFVVTNSLRLRRFRATR